MDAVVPILSYTELPRGSSIGLERSGEACTIRFRAPRVRPEPAPPLFTRPPAAGQAWWSLLLVPAFGLLWLFFWACGISLLEFARTLAMVTATVVPVVVVLSGLITAHLFIRGALPGRVKLVVTRKHLILHTRSPDRPVIRHRVGEVAAVSAINGRLSIRLINGRGWLDGAGVGPFYFEQGIREDELRWLVRILRQELGLAGRHQS